MSQKMQYFVILNLVLFWNKIEIKKLDKRLTNIRDDCHEKIINHILLTPPSVIVLEDLYIKEEIKIKCNLHPAK